jgi:hypothetical protein
MMDRRHRHRAVRRGDDWGWVACVADGTSCHAAHGGITYTEYCSCGAARRVEVNGAHRAKGPWKEAACSGEAARAKGNGVMRC